jgi:4-aminobutyrate aminotransferase/(S)-3-amino-2-methylpropionate transaminase
MGDPTRTMQARQIIHTIKDYDLVKRTDDVGKYIHAALADMIENGAGRGKVEKLRGENAGTFIAFDGVTSETRDKLILEMRKQGVHMGGCGDKAVRLRPMLVFERKHADLFLERLEKALGQL